VVAGSEVEFHVQRFSKTAEEVGHELRTSIGSTMSWNTVLREHVQDEELG